MATSVARSRFRTAAKRRSALKRTGPGRLFASHGRVEPTWIRYFEPIGLATKSFGTAKAHHLQTRAVGEFDQQHECFIESHAIGALLHLSGAGEKFARGPHDLRALLADHRGRLLRLHL